MPRRHVLLAAAMTSLLTGCGAKRPPGALPVEPGRIRASSFFNGPSECCHPIRCAIAATFIDKEADTKTTAAQLGHASEDVTTTFYIAKPATAPDVSDILEQLADSATPAAKGQPARLRPLRHIHALTIQRANHRQMTGPEEQQLQTLETMHINDALGCPNPVFGGTEPTTP